MAERAHERLLENVLGVFRVAYDPANPVLQAWSVAPAQFHERMLVAAFGRRENIQFIVSHVAAARGVELPRCCDGRIARRRRMRRRIMQTD